MNIEISMISAGANGAVFGSAWYGPSAGVYEYDAAGGVWISRNELPPDSDITLNDIFCGSDQFVWATGANADNSVQALYVWNDSEDGWQEVSRPVGNDHSATPIVGADGTVWLYTMMLDGPEDKALWLYGGDNAWTPIENADAQDIWQVSIADANNIYSVRNDGSGKIYKYDAAFGWQEQPGPPLDNNYRSLHLNSIGAATDGTLVVSGTLYNSPSDWQAACWQRAAGASPWVEMPQPSTNSVQYVSAGAANNIWGIGYQNTFAVFQWDTIKGQWHGVITSDVPAAQVIQKVQTNLTNMIELGDKYHDYFQDNINELYTLMQVNDTDPGQTIVTSMIRLSFKAVAAAPFPGAGAVSGVLGGVFDWMVADYSGDLNKVFANVWARFAANSQYLRTTLSNIHDDVAGYWAVTYTNPDSGEITKVADLFESQMPGENDAKPFNDVLQATLKEGRYGLWQQVLGTKWNNVSIANPSPYFYFKTQAEANAWIESYVNTNENYYITLDEEDGRYYPNEHWLGYGLFPYGHHEAPSALCEALFTDDGLGNVVRPDSITTRSDVFNNWGLPVQKVTIPPTTTVQAPQATALPATSLGEALRDSISIHRFTQMPRTVRRRTVPPIK
jgi:hypothetical protein